jgi:hypothetical protein
MDSLRTANLALRFALELGALGAAAYWGATISAGALGRAAAGVLLPLAIALIWAAFVSPKARFPTGSIGRAGLGLVVFLIAAGLLWNREHRTLATVYGAAALVSSIVLYLLPQ